MALSVGGEEIAVEVSSVPMIWEQDGYGAVGAAGRCSEETLARVGVINVEMYAVA